MTDDTATRTKLLAGEADQDDGSAFRTAYRGSFVGLLAWEDATGVFNAVRTAPACWWIYDTRATLPEEPEHAERLAKRIDEIEQFLRRNHKADYCGFVYVDDKILPRLIKVFDPRNASSCSLGSPVPVFTISRLRPVALPLGEGACKVNGGAAGETEGETSLMHRILKRLT